MKNMMTTESVKRAVRSMTRLLAAGVIATAAAGLARAEEGTAPKAGQPEKTRVGTYDSRAVAVAYYRSEAWRLELRRHHAEHETAKAAGDTKRAAELEKWGEAAQEQAHRQTFGDAPIDNILVAMTNSLPQILKQANVQKIVASTMPREASVETVDVTALMMGQFHPDEKTLKIIEDLKQHPPTGAGPIPHKD